MADDGAAAVIAAGGTFEPIGSELPQFCNRLHNALNDKSRLRLVKAADFSFSCAEAASVVAEVHEQDGKSEALLFLYPKLTDPSSFDGLLGETLQWAEDREVVKGRVASLSAEEAGGKTVGGGAAIGATLAAPSDFERSVPIKYNAPTAVRDPSAKVSSPRAVAARAAAAEEQQRAAAARAAAAEVHAEAVRVDEELAAVSAAIDSTAAVPAPEPQPQPQPPQGGGYFSLSELQAGCPAGVDAANKELSLDPAEFESTMGCSPADFAKLPKWKQSAAKKKALLF
jgi:hypothetical protein